MHLRDPSDPVDSVDADKPGDPGSPASHHPSGLLTAAAPLHTTPAPSRRGAAVLWALLCVLAGALQAASVAWPLAGWALPGTTLGQPSGAWQIASLALLVLALQHSPRVTTAAWRGWLFATAWLACTFWWLFISMHTYGGLPAWLAVLAVLALAGALALYYAGAAALLKKLSPRSAVGQTLLFAALWTLAELARGRWFTGFPWGAGGYAQVDLLGAWAPFVGVYGLGFMAALLAGALACAVGSLWTAVAARSSTASGSAGPRQHRAPAGWGTALPAALLLAALGWSAWGGDSLRALGQRETAAAGELRVWLLQGNIAQDEKFVAGSGVAQALGWYPQQMQQAVELAAQLAGKLPGEHPGEHPEQLASQRVAQAPQLVVAPETALPMLPQQLPAGFWRPLLEGLAQPGPSPAGPHTPSQHQPDHIQPDHTQPEHTQPEHPQPEHTQPSQSQPVHVLMGLPLGSFTEGYTNSAWGVSPASAAQALGHSGGLADAARQPNAPVPPPGFYRYDKHHLVPFGEFIPPLFRWFTELMNIPLGDFNRGGLGQAPWVVAGQRLAPNICYEDLFGEELAAGFADPALAPTVLVNLSNIGWFGDSIAIDQHLHISRLRALELGRPMLRATNTGATAVIDHRGVVTHQLPRLTQGRLDATVQGRSGTTPFARWASRWGVWPVWGLCLGLVLLIAATGRRVVPAHRS